MNVRKTNNGKLMAAIAIFAMVACVFAVAVQTDAVGDENGAYLDGTVEGQYGSNPSFSISNSEIGNNITVTKDPSSTATDLKYTISGNIQYIGTNTEITSLGEGASEVQKDFMNSKTVESTYDAPYGIVFTLVDNTYTNGFVAYPAPSGGFNYAAMGGDNYLNVLKYIADSNEATSTDTYYFCATKSEDNAAPASDFVKVTVSYDLTLTKSVSADEISSSDAFSDADVITVTDGTIDSVDVPADKTLIIDSGVEFGESATLDVAVGGNVEFQNVSEATFTVNGGDTGATTTVTFTNVSGNFTVTGGSVIVNGTISGAIEGNVDISGVINKDLVITGTGITIEDVTVNPGVTLTINGTANVIGDMRLYGTIAAPKEGSATIDVTGTLTAYMGATVAKGVTVTGSGKIDLSAAMSTVTLNDDIESDFEASQSQKVVIADTLTIKSGYTVKILGELIINEGCTVIIEDGATLILGDTEKNIIAKGMTVNGTIDVEVGGTIDVEKAENVTIVGTINSSGTVEINSIVTVKNGGSIFIDDYEDADGVQQSAITVTSGLTIENGGELTVSGDMNITDISNKGSIVLNGANITAESTISLTADGAIVDIKSMTQNADANLIINDKEMYLFTTKDKTDIVIDEKNTNSITFTAAADNVGIRNITVTASVTSEEIDNNTVGYVSSLILSGSVTILDDTKDVSFEGSYTIDVSGNVTAQNGDGYSLTSTIEVPESFTIGKKVLFNLKTGVMNVDGTMTATAEGSAITSTGDIFVEGMITTAIDVPITAGINAFHYTDIDYNYYTTLKTAIDSGATDIKYYGNVKVLDTLTIPADVILSKDSNAGKITIGDGDNRDVIVTVADGAIVRGCTIDVMATLVFDNNKTGNRNNDIQSDVIIDEEPKRTYTNIYTALDDAADNSTITIARNVFLDKDAEVRQTITLKIPAAYGVYLDNGITLTINGTVENSGKIGNAVAGLNNEPNTTGMVGFNPDVQNHATIVVNGTIMSMSELPYDTYYIVGAYYQLVNENGAWNYITPVEQAAVVSNDVEYGEIGIYGDNIVADVTFSGDADQAVTVTVFGNLEAGSVTVNMAGVVVEGAFTGTVASAVGTVEAVNATGFSVIDTVVGTENTQVTYLTGNPVAADKDLDSSLTVATGTVNAGKIDINVTDASDFAINEGATLMVSGQYDGANAGINAAEMTVNGTLVAADGGNVNVETMTVRGTFSVVAEDKESGAKAGTATITTLYVGIAYNADKNTYGDTSAATVNADKIDKLTDVFVSAESTVTGDLTSKMNTTGFYIEDALWMTIYTTDAKKAIVSGSEGDESYGFIPGDLVNCDFSYWATEDGKKIITSDNIFVGKVDKVFANLNYNIYTVKVYADPGVDAVYIDGVLMTGQTAGQYGWSATIAAGTHEISYKLANGYSGTATMTVNGTEASGLTFETSGTSVDDRNVTIYLQGIDKAGYVTDSPDASGDGFTITDYLLIILVVLIAIMAIMVAMRLMRS